MYVLVYFGVNVVFNLIRKRGQKRNSTTSETIPVAQNVSYATHTVRNAIDVRTAKEGDYELIDVLPSQPYANVQPPSST